jgi:hypothetical protein
MSSVGGTSRHFAATQYPGRFRGEADMTNRGWRPPFRRRTGVEWESTQTVLMTAVVDALPQAAESRSVHGADGQSLRRLPQGQAEPAMKLRELPLDCA